MALPTRTRRLCRWLRQLLLQPETTASLDDVEAERTIGDVVDTQRLQDRLPGEWHVERDIVQFSGEPLTEVVRVTNSQDGYRITLKPADMLAPTGRIHVYTRRSPASERCREVTIDSLSAARAAVERIAVRRASRAPTDPGR